jgi:hypothetical protein
VGSPEPSPVHTEGGWGWFKRSGSITEDKDMDGRRGSGSGRKVVKVRDVELMGITGGWYILGIGWMLEEEIRRRKGILLDEGGKGEEEEEGMVYAGGKRSRGVSRMGVRDDESGERDSLGSGGDSKTTESTIIKTPGVESEGDTSVEKPEEDEFDRLKLLVSSLLPRSMIHTS